MTHNGSVLPLYIWKELHSVSLLLGSESLTVMTRLGRVAICKVSRVQSSSLSARGNMMRLLVAGQMRPVDRYLQSRASQSPGKPVMPIASCCSLCIPAVHAAKCTSYLNMTWLCFISKAAFDIFRCHQNANSSSSMIRDDERL